jgi:hypothetical protein
MKIRATLEENNNKGQTIQSKTVEFSLCNSLEFAPKLINGKYDPYTPTSIMGKQLTLERNRNSKTNKNYPINVVLNQKTVGQIYAPQAKKLGLLNENGYLDDDKLQSFKMTVPPIPQQQGEQPSVTYEPNITDKQINDLFNQARELLKEFRENIKPEELRDYAAVAWHLCTKGDGRNNYVLEGFIEEIVEQLETSDYQDFIVNGVINNDNFQPTLANETINLKVVNLETVKNNQTVVKKHFVEVDSDGEPKVLDNGEYKSYGTLYEGDLPIGTIVKAQVNYLNPVTANFNVPLGGKNITIKVSNMNDYDLPNLTEPLKGNIRLESRISRANHAMLPSGEIIGVFDHESQQILNQTGIREHPPFTHARFLGDGIATQLILTNQEGNSLIINPIKQFQTLIGQSLTVVQEELLAKLTNHSENTVLHYNNQPLMNSDNQPSYHEVFVLEMASGETLTIGKPTTTTKKAYFQATQGLEGVPRQLQLVNPTDKIEFADIVLTPNFSQGRITPVEIIPPQLGAWETVDSQSAYHPPNPEYLTKLATLPSFTVEKTVEQHLLYLDSVGVASTLEQLQSFGCAYQIIPDETANNKGYTTISFNPIELEPTEYVQLVKGSKMVSNQEWEQILSGIIPKHQPAIKPTQQQGLIPNYLIKGNNQVTLYLNEETKLPRSFRQLEATPIKLNQQPYQKFSLADYQWEQLRDKINCKIYASEAEWSPRFHELSTGVLDPAIRQAQITIDTSTPLQSIISSGYHQVEQEFIKIANQQGIEVKGYCYPNYEGVGFESVNGKYKKTIKPHLHNIVNQLVPSNESEVLSNNLKMSDVVIFLKNPGQDSPSAHEWRKQLIEKAKSQHTPIIWVDEQTRANQITTQLKESSANSVYLTGSPELNPRDLSRSLINELTSALNTIKNLESSTKSVPLNYSNNPQYNSAPAHAIVIKDDVWKKEGTKWQITNSGQNKDVLMRYGTIKVKVNDKLIDKNLHNLYYREILGFDKVKAQLSNTDIRKDHEKLANLINQKQSSPTKVKPEHFYPIYEALIKEKFLQQPQLLEPFLGDSPLAQENRLLRT